MGNKKSAAGCQNPADPPEPTVRQAAQRLLDAIALLFDGPEGVGFHGWENSRGEPAGDAVEEACHELIVALASTRAPKLLTRADFDEEVFERVWRSEDVQHAGRRLGWRGVAEAVWAAAFEQARVP